MYLFEWERGGGKLGNEQTSLEKYRIYGQPLRRKDEDAMTGYKLLDETYLVFSLSFRIRERYWRNRGSEFNQHTMANLQLSYTLQGLRRVPKRAALHQPVLASVSTTFNTNGHCTGIEEGHSTRCKNYIFRKYDFWKPKRHNGENTTVLIILEMN